MTLHGQKKTASPFPGTGQIGLSFFVESALHSTQLVITSENWSRSEAKSTTIYKRGYKPEENTKTALCNEV
jgi:hypothetical protein